MLYVHSFTRNKSSWHIMNRETGKPHSRLGYKPIDALRPFTKSEAIGVREGIALTFWLRFLREAIISSLKLILTDVNFWGIWVSPERMVPLVVTPEDKVFCQT